MIKQSFVIKIIDNSLVTIISAFTIPVLFFIFAFFLESDENENKKIDEK